MIKSHIVDDYLNYLSASKGASETTLMEYYYDVRNFLRYMRYRKEDLDIHSEDLSQISIDNVDIDFIKTIDKQDIYAYISYLDKVRKNSNRTRYRKLSSIRSFYNYLCNKVDLLDHNPSENIDLPRIEKRLPVHLSLDDCIKLLDHVESYKQREIYRCRDVAIVTLFLNTGLRLSELSALNVKDISPDNTINIIGKGNKERMIYLNDSTMDALNDYLRIRKEEGLENQEALFLSMRKNRMSNRSIQHMIKKHLEEAGFDTTKYTVHKLRHTAATLIYHYGNTDLRSLQEILGHESVTTTQIYTHVKQDEIKQAMLDNPLGHIDEIRETKK